jgi:mitotic-spindle organizing protein 1
MKDMSKESSVRQPPGSGRQQQQGSSRIIEARETFSTLLEISRLLNTGLDAETLAICVRLCEQGANPEALATVIRELRRESAAIRQQEAENPPPSL